jgi:hypothetical protein
MALDVGCGEVGRPPYPLVLMLKMLLLAYLFNLSERQVAVYVQENLPARWFVGLAVNAPRLLIQGRFCLDTTAVADPGQILPGHGKRGWTRGGQNMDR